MQEIQIGINQNITSDQIKIIQCAIEVLANLGVHMIVNININNTTV